MDALGVTEILTSAQMRAIERAAIDSRTVTGAGLMDRAGAAVVAAALAYRPALRRGRRRALVLCGPGNNGGDGYVIARRLHDRGWKVEVLAWGDPAALPPDARAMHEAWAALGRVEPLHLLGGGGPDQAPDLIVDAVFGTGLTRPLPETVGHVLTGIDDCCERMMLRPLIVAVDVPSGLSADSGHALGRVLRAGLTVTFHAPKLGHYLGQGPALCGDLMVADIGLPPRPRFQQAPRDVVREARPAPVSLRKPQGHKYDHGHVLVLAGDVGRGGAARLAARAALRVGAGLVTLAPPPAALIENAARLDAVMLTSLRDAAGLEAILADARIRALCLGPGLGLGEREAALVAAALAAPDPAPHSVARRRAVVLDADALTLIARDPALASGLHGDCILTPHAGEFARLVPDLAAREDWSATDRVRAAAERLGAVVLLKGPATVIAAPGGFCLLSPAAYGRAAPWLATAGAGDVLAGLIAGLAARGLPGLDAAAQGAALHLEAALAVGPGLIAEDLTEALPGVFRDLGL
jgi:ADP-dependent NAD(P)H-hydrate dehydratase / NAD(P)H-hydrate epimerase